MVKKFLFTRWVWSIAILIMGFSDQALGIPPPERKNVILLVLDQLRADRLSSYGNPHETSPNIDRLAARGVRFARYYSVSPWTAPSYATLMTSLYPSRHGVTLFWQPGMPLIDKDLPMLAQVFREHGYHTTAFVNNGLAGYGMTGRGFDEYYEGQWAAQATNITERAGGGVGDTYKAPATMARVLPWLNAHRSDPFFLWVLFFEPHSPFDPPPEHDIFKSNAYPYLFDTGYDITRAPLKRLGMLGDKAAIERLYQLYDGKVHYIDSYVGQLSDYLQKLGLAEKTLIFVTSDHGELMFTHPEDYLTSDHRGPYDPVLHIPFIAVGPGVPEGKVIDGIASNLDSAPTILDLADLPPLPGAQGLSLVPSMNGKMYLTDRYVYSEEDTAIPWRYVRNDRYKLIFNLWTLEKRLFDLEKDPEEKVDVAAGKPEVFRDLDARLKKWMQENQPPAEKQKARWRIYGHTEKTLTVDDQTIGGRLLLTGTGWHSDTSPGSGNFEGGCFWTEPGAGNRSAVWRGDNPLLGPYRIYIYYGSPSVGRLATNATFVVKTENGESKIRVNFNQNAAQWNLLGTFDNPRTVTVTNAADGNIVVDAVKFERLE